MAQDNRVRKHVSWLSSPESKNTVVVLLLVDGRFLMRFQLKD